MKHSAREEEWAGWMRSAMDGDTQAYHRFLSAVTPHLRAMARRRCDQFGAPASEAEDVVQEVLLAVHLKRGSWDPARPIGPWLSTIVRNKLIDSLRRRGRHIDVPIDDVMATLEAEEQAGYHTTGRSAAIWVLNYGPPDVRILTGLSKPYFLNPPEGFGTLARPRPVLYLAPETMAGALDELLASGVLEDASRPAGRDDLQAELDAASGSTDIERQLEHTLTGHYAADYRMPMV